MITNHHIDNYINNLHYLLYDGDCFICRICAYICKRIFQNTCFISFEHFYDHWYMFPKIVKNIDRRKINIFFYNNKEWMYDKDAIKTICQYNDMPFEIFYKLFQLASLLRKKCNSCKLSK